MVIFQNNTSFLLYSLKKKGTETAPLGHHFGKRLSFAKRELFFSLIIMFRTCFTDGQTVPQGSRFGATYFFECCIRWPYLLTMIIPTFLISIDFDIELEHISGQDKNRKDLAPTNQA